AAPGSAADSPLAAALRIARRTGARLTVLDAARRRAPPAFARELLGLGVRLAGYAPLEPGRVDAATLVAHAAHAGLLVLPAAASADPVLVSDLATRLRGALMLLRGGSPRAGTQCARLPDTERRAQSERRGRESIDRRRRAAGLPARRCARRRGRRCDPRAAGGAPGLPALSARRRDAGLASARAYLVRIVAPRAEALRSHRALRPRTGFVARPLRPGHT